MSKRKRERHILTFNRHRAAGRDDDDDDDADSKKDPFEIDEEDYHNVDIVLRGFSIYNQDPDRSSTSIIDNRVTCSMDGSRVTHLKADSRSFLCSHRDASYIFSSDIGRLEALEFLSLASGTFDSIPDEIGNLVNLRVLDLENCGLVESLPTSIQKLKNLEKLVLCHTSVDCLPEAFGSLSKLKYLDIGFTCIILLPSTFRHLTQLEYLNLSSTPIYSLPSGFQQLVNLKNLIMFDCIRLSKFPSSIGKLESLEKLSISFSHFQEDADEDVLASLDTLLDLRVGRGGDDPEFIYRSAAKLPDMSKVPKITTNVKNLSAFNPATYNDCCVDELHVELCFKGYTVEGEDEDEEDVAHLTNIRETVNCLQHLRCWHNLACLELGLFCESFSSGIHLNYVSVDLCHCHSAFRLNGSFFQSLPNLTLLRILNHEFPQMYPRVRWEEISCLKKLQSIALIGCLVVADPGMVATLPQLTNIEIRDHCDDINPEVLTCLDAPALNSLELNGCSLSNNDLQEIQDGFMTRCPLLGTLVLDHNPGIDTLPTTLSTGIRELSILHTRLQCNPDETLIRIAKENPGFVCVGCCTENSEFNRQLGMNRARALVLEREEICRLLWPRILQNASKAFSCRECAVDKRCTFCDAELSNADAIFHLLKLRGAADIFSDRLEDGKRRSKRDENSKRTLEPRPGNRTRPSTQKPKSKVAGTCLALSMLMVTFLCGVEGFLIGRRLCRTSSNLERCSHLEAEPTVLPSVRNPAAPHALNFTETPHAGRHFLPSHPAYRRPWIRRLFWRRRRRFMEGWYYRLTLVEENVSFAFILSIEDPGIKSSELSLACIQVVGPDDTYLVQASKDDTKFWASRNTQALGYVFSYFDIAAEDGIQSMTELAPEVWRKHVESGFQIQPRHLLGRVRGHDGSRGGVLDGQGIEGYCDFDFVVDPKCGWGSCNCESVSTTLKQKSTGGWLSSFPVFEPHWQVTYADARASGTVIWNGTRYEFTDQPFYAEKNWGKSLPRKWYWTQCNSFNGYNDLSVTAGGGIRKVPFGQEESLGMVSVHYNGTFYEAVPWKGDMEWNVSTWGYWGLRGSCYEGANPFAVEVTYECDPEELPGLVFRAPTPDEGMVYFCRDTFDAKCTLSLWELEVDRSSLSGRRKFIKKEPPIIDRATSRQGGAEIGGGPWWSEWKAKSRLKRVIKTLLSLPNKLESPAS